MKKLEVIALLLSAFIEISTAVSIYSIISDAEHVSNDNRIPKKLQPVELMVDATNHLGFTILDLHSKLNKNNIAFSPCGLMSVLVALYEGTGGKSGIELKEALHFPRERDIVRIGVRDIHRRLRSYFYKKENLLSGLIFNKENITIRQEYETVLRFYGYDLDGASNMLTESQVDSTDDDDDNGGSTNATDSSTPPAIMKTTTTKIVSSTSNEANDTITERVTTPTLDETSSSSASKDEDDTVLSTTVANEANGTDDDSVVDDDEETTVAEAVTTTTTTAASSKRKRRGGRGFKQRKDRKQSSAVTVKSPAVNRRSRSYYVLLDEDYENEFHLEASPPPPPSLPIPVTTPSISSTTNHHHFHHHHHHHYEPSSTENPISTFRPTTIQTIIGERGDDEEATSVGKYRIHNHKDLFENVNSDTIEHIFHLNEYDTVRVPYKLYDTVMKYAYVSSLQASFLEIDLDSEYYGLIIIIPDHHSGLSTLAEKLKAVPANTLRNIRTSMEFYWVKTIVPKFSLKGNTILTNDLQNMGINDIFEPTKADFSLMAEDKSLYVKNIEQMININIRTQSTQQLKKISSLYKRPIEVPVNIPFIYCVVDKKLDLIIILGRILNPLNSRIQ